MMRPPTELEKIFAKCISNKVMMFILYKELSNFNSKKLNLIKKQAGDINGHFSKIYKWPTDR